VTAKNDVTGDLIKTKSSSQQYRDNWDLIFRKKEKEPEEKDEKVLDKEE
jgi:hypothetical protein